MNKRKWLILYIGILIITVVLLRAFVFETYLVTQTSMCNTLFDGDKVLVRKKSGENVNRGDIIVYQSGKETFIKRVAGMPGEMIQISANRVFIDSTEWFVPGAVIPASNPANGNTQLDMMVYDCYGKLWTMNDFGPYRIPKKGLTIKLDSTNIMLYRKILEAEGISVQNPRILPATYTFSKNYLFILGDNRPVSKDSRSFGVIATNQVIGRASMVLFSKRALFSTARLFKKIR